MQEGKKKTNLDISAPAIKIQVQILNLTKVAKLVLNCLFICLLVNIRHHDNPALNGAHRRRLGRSLHE